jgi:hypothetical protein
MVWDHIPKAEAQQMAQVWAIQDERARRSTQALEALTDPPVGSSAPTPAPTQDSLEKPEPSDPSLDLDPRLIDELTSLFGGLNFKRSPDSDNTVIALDSCTEGKMVAVTITTTDSQKMIVRVHVETPQNTRFAVEALWISGHSTFLQGNVLLSNGSVTYLKTGWCSECGKDRHIRRTSIGRCVGCQRTLLRRHISAARPKAEE